MRKLLGPVLRIPNTGGQWHGAWLSTPQHETWHRHFPQWRGLRGLRDVWVRRAHALGGQGEIDESESYVDAALSAGGGFSFLEKCDVDGDTGRARGDLGVFAFGRGCKVPN